MRVLNSFNEASTISKPKRTKKEWTGKRKKVQIPPKQNLSPQEIRDKLAASKKKIEDAKVPQKEPMSAKEAEKKADHLLTSDVSKNDPNDPNTKSKLKDVLSTGGFNFSDKEKAVLGKILKDH